jgi:hypothetical protein
VHQSGNEAQWWEDMDIDALEIAKGLWSQSRAKATPSGSLSHDVPEVPSAAKA